MKNCVTYALDLQEQQGWSDTDLLCYCLEYINNHAGHQSFKSFLDGIIEQENEEASHACTDDDKP